MKPNRFETRLLCATTIWSLMLSAPVFAQCSNWVVGPLDHGAAPNGTNQSVLTLSAWAPTGAAAPMLVAGGFFTNIQGMSANKIAARDGTTGDWQGLSGGVAFGSADAYASAVYNGELYAGLIQNEGFILRWNGTAWQNVGNIEGTDVPFVAGRVEAMAIYNGELIVAGRFAIAGGTFANSVARWNGTSWAALGTGLIEGGSPLASAYALAIHNGELIVGGSFDTAGGVACAKIARWNGTSWAAFSTGGMNGTVRSLGKRNGFLYAGGDFTTAGGVACNRIARWFDGPPNPGWFALGSGMNGAVGALTEYNGDLIAGGGFTTAGGIGVGRIARWNGTTWIAMGSGLSGASVGVNTLLSYGGELIAGGSFSTAGGFAANNLARWNGSRWTNFGGGSVSAVDTFATLGSRIVAGGNFSQATNFAQGAYNVVGWDGVNLTPLGTGMNNEVLAMKTYDYPAPSEDRELVAGGWFTTAGGVAANRIARWIENPANNPPAQWAPMGAGFNDAVVAVERVGGTYVAGGAFTLSGATGINRIAYWNESNATWSEIQGGIGGTVWALKFYATQDPPPFPVMHQYLVAGGDFTSVSGGSANRIAITELNAFCCNNFTPWSAIGQGFNGPVNAIERFNGSVYAGGQFTASGSTTVNHIARWTGSGWVAVGNFDGPIVSALKASGNYLYAGGFFTTVNGTTTNHIARYNGSVWEVVQGGADHQVITLAVFNNEIQAGGIFDDVGAPSIASRGWARFLQTGAPWIAQQPSPQTVGCRGNADFQVEPAVGYNGLTYQWRKNGTTVVNGPTGSGSTIAGATTGTLSIQRISRADQGTYDCIVSNTCGSATSLAAALTASGCPPPGDVNGDGVFNTSDIAPFAQSLVDPTAYQLQYPEGDIYNGDMNGDSAINGRDIGPFVACLLNGSCQ